MVAIWWKSQLIGGPRTQKNVTVCELHCQFDIKPFNVNAWFLYPLKTSENKKFADVSRGYRSVTLAWIGLIKVRMLVVLTAWKVSEYGVFSGPNTGKYRPKKTPYLDTLHAVTVVL